MEIMQYYRTHMGVFSEGAEELLQNYAGMEVIHFCEQDGKPYYAVLKDEREEQVHAINLKYNISCILRGTMVEANDISAPDYFELDMVSDGSEYLGLLMKPQYLEHEISQYIAGEVLGNADNQVKVFDMIVDKYQYFMNLAVKYGITTHSSNGKDYLINFNGEDEYKLESTAIVVKGDGLWTIVSDSGRNIKILRIRDSEDSPEKEVLCTLIDVMPAETVEQTISDCIFTINEIAIGRLKVSDFLVDSDFDPEPADDDFEI